MMTKATRAMQSVQHRHVSGTVILEKAEKNIRRNINIVSYVYLPW